MLIFSINAMCRHLLVLNHEPQQQKVEGFVGIGWGYQDESKQLFLNNNQRILQPWILAFISVVSGFCKDHSHNDIRP